MDVPKVTPEALAWGFGVLVVGFVAGRLLRLLVTWVLTKRGRSSGSADVFGRLASTLSIVLAAGAALTIVFPSVKPVDILGGLGVISIAAGIAFQTVLGNIFAGLIILGRDRFQVGDQISVGDHAGTVVERHLSSTAIKTFDGRLVLVPNQKLHSEPVTVQTGFEAVRSSLILDVDSSANLDQVRHVAVEAMRSLGPVLPTPEPQALLASVGPSTVELELRFWSGARQMETREAKDCVISGVLRAFQDADIALATNVQAIEIVSTPSSSV